MKISTDLLTSLAKVLGAIGVQPSDHTFEVPAQLQPVSLFPHPMGIANQGSAWNTSGFTFVSHDVEPAGADQSTIICDLNPGIWHVHVQTSFQVIAVPTERADPSYNITMGSVETGIGGEIFVAELQPFTVDFLFTLREPMRFTSVARGSVAGDFRASVIFMANRLFP